MVMIAARLSHVPAGKQLFPIMNRPVARMMPMTQGFSPRRTAWTSLFFRTAFRTTMTSRMMTNAGSTTAVVASNAPQNPAWLLPIYVARLTMMGPGVLSLIAII